jgi:hypothetical protein
MTFQNKLARLALLSDISVVAQRNSRDQVASVAKPETILLGIASLIARVMPAGITQHPAEEWMVQIVRKAIEDLDGALLPIRYSLHDRDTKFCNSFPTMLQSGGVEPIPLPPRELYF